MLTYAVSFVVSLLIVAGQGVMKKGLLKTEITQTEFWPMLGEAAAAFLHPKPIIGFLMCGLGAIIYYLALRFVDISQLLPMTAGGVVMLTALMGWAFFHEPMPLYKLAALGMIAAGVMIVGHTKI
ncbi:MAG: hypothetical protein EA357_11370 [Micavibrio sp.]|nr:MAG: hypothetical protein EA357_11370 [Micavibrio sp.]